MHLVPSLGHEIFPPTFDRVVVNSSASRFFLACSSSLLSGLAKVRTSWSYWSAYKDTRRARFFTVVSVTRRDFLCLSIHWTSHASICFACFSTHLEGALDRAKWLR